MTILNIAVAGSSGRMGRALLSAIMKDPGSHLKAALEMDGNPYIGKGVSELTGDLGSVVITDNFSAVLP
ncbi:MAG: 4-hydroxy-tetrahydrodipicolinate reductase, partial [Nitrosomonadaceae bacterium]|nr:4-hydroxy-tetrahydrodipicolinate reductase [Nitrosomonadaceae bacterium]